MAYGLELGHLLVLFGVIGERELVLGLSWIVAGQVLAVEPKRPSFFSMEGVVQSALAWVWLAWLLVKFSGVEASRRS